jgi:hypothetical protein
VNDDVTVVRIAPNQVAPRLLTTAEIEVYRVLLARLFNLERSGGNFDAPELVRDGRR